MRRLTVKTPNKKDYDIVITSDFDALIPEFERLGYKGRKALVVSDSNVAPIHMGAFKAVLSKCDILCNEFIFKAGEESKTKQTVDSILDKLVELGFKRSDLC
ncbi:MAG: 3-dehydroquinate synthase, partial [Lachnospiraceae bacterium]|nr:3-dehydroquinate synthase [Lachnospiraceae bacterium]